MFWKNNKIGYQGVKGSNSELAATLICEELAIDNFDLIPCVTSKEVIEQLKHNKIDFGVMAVKNSTSGEVEESKAALRNIKPKVVTKHVLPISHCIFTTDSKTAKNIKHIYSHTQALKQCANYISKNYPEVQPESIEDTAIGAEQLKSGKFPPGSAVICSKRAGKLHDLQLIDQDIQDKEDNRTEFIFFKIDKKPNNAFRRFIYGKVNEKLLEKLHEVLFGLILIICVLLTNSLHLNLIESVSYIGFLGAAAIWCVSSAKIREKLNNDSIIGFWKYYVESSSGENIQDQKPETPRYVHIDEDSGKLRMRGYIADSPNELFFCSRDIILSPFGKKHGKVAYWYTHGDATTLGGKHVQGAAFLTWDREEVGDKIITMSGWYIGSRHKDYGVVKYERIDKEEYQNCIGSTLG